MALAAAFASLVMFAAACGSTVRSDLGASQRPGDGFSAETSTTTTPGLDVGNAPMAGGTATGETSVSGVGLPTERGATPAGQPPSGAGSTSAVGEPGTGGTITPEAPNADGGAPSGAASGFGFTADTLRVGIVTVSSESGQQMEDVGFGAAALGDSIGMYRALVDSVNANGGVAGRQAEAVIATIDQTTTQPERDFEAICTRFTQDDPVFAVVTVTLTQSFAGCLGAAGVPVLGGTAALDVQALAALPLAAVPASAPLDSGAATMAAALAAEGFFTDGDALAPSRIGLLREDRPVYERAGVALQQALAAAGLAVGTEVVVTATDDGQYGDQASQIAGAVLRMRSDGVTHIVFVSFNALSPVLFMNAAAAQGYRPRYGLNTQQFPQPATELVTDRSQLIGSRTVGWQPINDTDTSVDPTRAARSEECLALMREAGITVATTTEQLAAFVACDSVWLLDLAGEQMGEPEVTRFMTALTQMGEIPSALNLSMAFSQDRRFGPSSYRTGGYDQGCSCFLYDPNTSPEPMR